MNFVKIFLNLGKLFARMFVKNPGSQQFEQGMEAVADATVEAVEEATAKPAEPQPNLPRPVRPSRP